MRFSVVLLCIALLAISASALSGKNLRKNLQRSSQSLSASHWPFGGDVDLEKELRALLVEVATGLIQVQQTAKSEQGESCERVAAFKWEPKVDKDSITHQVQGYCTIGSKAAILKPLGAIQNYNTITTLTNWAVRGVTPSTTFLAGAPMKLLHVGISVGAKMYLTSLMTKMNKQADMLMFLTALREANEQFPQTRTVKQLRAYTADSVLFNLKQKPDCVVDAAKPHSIWLWSIAYNLIEAYAKPPTRKLANKCLKLVSSELYTYAYAIQYSQFGSQYLDHSASPGAASAEIQKNGGIKPDAVQCGPHSFSCCLNEMGRLQNYGGLLGNDAYAIVLNTLAHGLYDAAQGKYKPGWFKDPIQPCADFIKMNEAALRVPEPRTPAKTPGADAQPELVPLTGIGLQGVPQPKEEKIVPQKEVPQLPAEEANKPVDEAIPVTQQ